MSWRYHPIGSCWELSIHAQEQRDHRWTFSASHLCLSHWSAVSWSINYRIGRRPWLPCLGFVNPSKACTTSSFAGTHLIYWTSVDLIVTQYSRALYCWLSNQKSLLRIGSLGYALSACHPMALDLPVVFPSYFACRYWLFRRQLDRVQLSDLVDYSMLPQTGL